MKPKIAIVNSSSFGNVFPQHLEELQEFSEVERFTVPVNISLAEFVRLLAPFHGIIASVNPHYSAELLEQLPWLVAITRHGIGYNNVDVAAATRLGIVVTKVAGPIERVAVAELAVSLLLTAARCVPEGRRAVRENRWSDRAAFIGVELTGKKVACIGLGNIGSRTAEILRDGFQATILAHDPLRTDEAIRALGYRPVSLSQALAEADFITLHCALTEGNHHMINAQSISTMKDGVIIANTARGELVDDRAVIAALRSRKIRTYATDVVEGEPIDNTHPLTHEPNAIVIPHLGGYTEESLLGMGQTMVSNMRDILTGQTVPADAINGAELPTVRAWQ